MFRIKLLVLLVPLVLLTGCLGGSGGGGGSSAGSSSSPSYFASSDSDSYSSFSASLPTYHNPEPSSLALLGVGLAGLMMSKRKKKK
ncbi:MAG: PEP-CTERM sorting domain-containing protein [Candidatus Omnitrophota bacterium]